MRRTKCATVVKKGNITIIKRSERTSDVWTSTNYTEERQRIREFWLQLSEEERRSLVKVEKEAVLRKMKEQQKHSCNCSVCGKKRTAIEDELEVLYDAYYEELEQYAYRQQQQRKLIHHPYYQKNREEESDADEDDEDEDDDDEDDDDEEEEDDEEDEEQVSKHMHFESTPSFSNTLTVQGSVITVADDLLKNDGKKFLDMMEELAERKSRQEKEVEDNFLFSDEEEPNDCEESENDDEEDEEDDDDEEEEEDDDDDDEEISDEEQVEIHKGKPNQDSRTEEQRMEEGRKMFQVFAARMFEQRVLNAYREKVAQDRQKRLIEELEEEDRLKQERELKKQQDKQKKRDKRRQLREQQEKERLELENKKRQEELAAKADREKKREESRLRKEQERQRKEEERLRKEEERKKKRLKAAEKERKRKEEEERKRKEEEELKRKQKQKEEQEPKQPSEKELDPTPIAKEDGSTTGPIGSPAKTEPFYVASETEHHHSFFSSFLFGQPILKKVQRNEHTYPWTNGWTPLLALSDTVHTKLLGDVLTDKTSVILERTKAAYLRLNELAQNKLHFIPRHHPLNEIHQTIQELYADPIDKQAIYKAILHSPSSGFQCFNLQHQGYVVQRNDYPNDIPPLLPISTHAHFSPFSSSSAFADSIHLS